MVRANLVVRAWCSREGKRSQEHGGEEQEEDDPGAEVRALRSPGGSKDQVGQVQHVVQAPSHRSVPGLRATGAAWSLRSQGGPAPPHPARAAPPLLPGFPPFRRSRPPEGALSSRIRGPQQLLHEHRPAQ